MRKTIFSILLALIILPSLVFAEDKISEGAGLYIEAMAAVSKKDFALAKAKFEEAAASLSGENQALALKIADFFGRMSSKITQKKLSLSDQWNILGEVKELDRFWHLYRFFDYGPSILRLAVKGERPLDEIVAVMGQDLFIKKQVIKNREGYISKPNTSVPGVVSRIRMWYCDKDNTTNIVYETDGYAKNAKLDLDPAQFILSELDLSFSNVKCSREFPIWILVIIIALVLLGIISWRLKLWQKIKKSGSSLSLVV